MTPGDRLVHWRSSIRANWHLCPLRYLVRFNPEVLPETTAEDELLKYIDISAVDRDGNVAQPEEILFGNAPSRARRVVRSGDVIISTVRTYLTAITRIETDGLTVSTGFAVLRPGPQVDSRFLGYWVRSQWFVDEIVARSTGVSYPAINSSEIGQLPFPVIPRSEQRAIAAFLDRETARIDDLIAKKKALVGLLQSRQDAIIRRLVLGFGLSCRMKYSRHEWMGDVPEHWSVMPLKRLAERVVVGIAEASTHAYADSGVPLVRTTNVRPNRIETSDLLFIEKTFADKNRSKYMKAGDIVTARTGNPGVSGVIPPELHGSQCFTMLITTLQAPHVPEFFCTFINSDVGRTYFALEGWGTAQINISVPILQMLPVPCPPESEQRSIVATISQAVSYSEQKIKLVSDTIERLAAYRSSLISAAVTGQIDVRNYRPKEAAASCP